MFILSSDTSTAVSVCERVYFIKISTLITWAGNEINTFGHHAKVDVTIMNPVSGVWPHVTLNMSTRNK